MNLRIHGRLWDDIPIPFNLIHPGIAMSLPDIPTHLAVSINGGPRHIAPVVLAMDDEDHTAEEAE